MFPGESASVLKQQPGNHSGLGIAVILLGTAGRKGVCCFVLIAMGLVIQVWEWREKGENIENSFRGL